ncbi:MAG: glycosyltransferase, partial [Solirubrobacterales bacterium]|nr:glycosyltransferase [Solirubrobacterales bacterium]
RFSILTPVHDPSPLYLDRAIASVLRQTAGDWELCLYDDASTDADVREVLAAHVEADPRVRLERGERSLNISGATNAALAMARGEFVCLLDHDDEIEPDAIATIASALDQHPEADMVYTDEATIDGDNSWRSNFLKPAWSPEFFESNMYTCHFGAYRREMVERLGGFRGQCDGSQDYDLVLRLGERSDRIVHAPGVKYYWRFHARSASAGAKPYAFEAAERALGEHFERAGRPGEAESTRLPGAYRRTPVESTDRVAVVLAVPAERQEAEAIATCLRAIAGAPAGPGVELICAAAGSGAADLCRGIAAEQSIEALVVEGPPAASRAELFDLAAGAAEVEAFVLLAEPVVPDDPAWLAELLTLAAIPEVGVVGSLGLSPDDRIEHGGVVISEGLPLVADLEEHLTFDDPEWSSPTQTLVRDYSAASGTVLVRREVLDRLGGLAAQGFDQLAEIDLCLRARAAGLRVAVTPLARMRRAATRCAAAETSLAELFAFQRRWWSRGVDPYYHPWLCRQRAILTHLYRFPRFPRPAPQDHWRPPSEGDGGPAPDALPSGAREELAAAFLHGDGLEIGPLHSPLRLPPGAAARYVDRMPVTLLRRHYPELAALPLIEVDILDDGERLDTIEAESQDFVIANHLLEHTGDPIATIGNWLRVLRPGGVIYLAVPDKRYTFDIDREVTPLEHIIRDHEEGPEVSRRRHFEEWARHVEGVSEEHVGERADALEQIDYSVHTHVFTERELLELLMHCAERFGGLEIEALRRNGIETLVVLRKPDPEAPRPDPTPAYEELPEPA